jgi:hypothetical protein
MARIKVPSGTIQKFEKVFDDLQTNVKLNVKLQFQALLNDVFGNIVSVNNGVISSTNLKLMATDSGANPRNVTIQPGTALTRSGDTIVVANPYVEDLSLASASAYYLIKANFQEIGGESITAMNAFLYDSTGTSAYSTKYTRFSDSFSITQTQIFESSG